MGKNNLLRILRFVRNRYQRKRAYDLGGPLKGFRMFGPLLNSQLDGTYEADMVQAMQIVQTGWTCVDVGSHTGFFTLLFSELCGPGGRVFSFEASPSNTRELQRNVKLNSSKAAIIVENMAITDGLTDTIPLYRGRNRSSYEWNILGHDVNGNPTSVECEVPCTSLDQFFKSDRRLDFIKMDVEGAETQAIRGMKMILHEVRPFVLIEFHNEGWEGRNDLFAADYRLYDLIEKKEVDPGNGKFAYHCFSSPSNKFDEVVRAINERGYLT